MASRAPRRPLRGKSLTLLELCQTVHDLRSVPAQNTSQIFTRRLYFYPVTINPGVKQRSPKLIARGLLHVDQSNLDKNRSSRKPALTSPLSISTRSNSKLNSSVVSDNNNASNELDTSTITSSFNQISLTPTTQNPPLATKKRTALARSLYVPPNHRKIPLTHKNPNKQLNIWHHLDDQFDRPSPKDPPGTPLDYAIDGGEEPDLQQQASHHSLPDINTHP